MTDYEVLSLFEELNSCLELWPRIGYGFYSVYVFL